MVYVERDRFGKKIDTLYVRMHKFANPMLRDDEESKEQVYEDMYNALATGSSSELARVFGMVNDNMYSYDRLFMFNNYNEIDTDAFIQQPGREVVGFSIG